MDLNHLDGPTVSFIAVVMTSVLTCVVLTAWRFNRRLPGLREWSLACLASLLLMLTLMSRARLTELAAVLLTNFLILLVAGLVWAGCRRHAGGGAPRPLALVLVAGTTLTLTAYLTAVYPDPVDRLLVQSIVAGSFYFLAAHAISTGGMSRYPARYLFALALVLHSAFLALFRPWLVMLGNPQLEDGNGSLVLPALPVLEALVFFTLMVVGIIMLINEHYAHQLRLLAENDALTQIPNRRAFLLMLDKACSQSRRSQTPLVVMMIDLDHFKRINDTWGHKAGDEVLRSFTALAASRLRNEDAIGRLGGEEFCLFLANAGLPDAKEVAERLRLASEADAVHSGAQTIHYTVSIGLALHDRNDSPQATIHRADQAMYRAKHGGRNRVETQAPAPSP